MSFWAAARWSSGPVSARACVRAYESRLPRWPISMVGSETSWRWAGSNRFDLARRVFGVVAIEAARARVIAPLQTWGYAAGTAMLSCLCEALLRNESPYPEHLSAETLERFPYGRVGVPALALLPAG